MLSSLIATFAFALSIGSVWSVPLDTQETGGLLTDISVIQTYWGQVTDPISFH